MIAEYLQDIGQQGDAGAEQDESDNIERMRVVFTVIRQMQIHENQTDEPDGNIEEEDDAPMKIADDQAAGDGTRASGRPRRVWRRSSSCAADPTWQMS
jgi:hypothetical protein